MTRVEHIGDATLYLGDCRDILPTLSGVDAVVTDPPYGARKAEWDDAFPTEWYAPACALAKRVVVITGSSGLRDSVDLVGADFIDVIAARNLNGMTRGPIGFGNWLAAVVAKGKPRMGINAFDFCVTADMPDHPSPKPIDYMLRLIERVTERDECVCDPFTGSGTTGVACIQLGRKFIGIEIEPKYFDIACRRIEEATKQGDLIRDILPKPEQKGLEL
jgi:site-specific DNA-methyltransferase (adenine-specific)